MNCLSDCISQYITGQVIKPIDAHVVSPFVKISFFGGQGLEITVGNESCPGLNNSAIIESFNYHSTNGIYAEIEVLDVQGGAFTHFAQRLGKCLENASKDYSMIAQWGWVTSLCGGDSQVTMSPPVRLQPMQLDVSVVDGKFKYRLNSTDLMQMVFSARGHKPIGREGGGGMSLRDAIKELFSRDEPKIVVKFKEKNPDGTLKSGEWDFETAAIKDSWQPDGQNKLTTARNWMAPFKSQGDGKGCIPAWSNTGEDANQPTLIFWKDVEIAVSNRSVGTFIVNGGPCSSVIRFNPTVNWAAGFGIFSVGGTAGNSSSGEQVVKKNNEPTQQGVNPGPDVGVNTSVSTSQQAKNAYGEQLNSKSSDAENAHLKANHIYLLGMQPIKAELEIQGNPSTSFVDLVYNKFRTASIVVINPFQLLGSGRCGDWLAYPGCNEVLSNREWQIIGCGHSIKAGSYVTTLDLSLKVPAVELNNNSPLGGEGSGGWKPDNACG